MYNVYVYIYIYKCANKRRASMYTLYVGASPLIMGIKPTKLVLNNMPGVWIVYPPHHAHSHSHTPINISRSRVFFYKSSPPLRNLPTNWIKRRHH